MHEAFLLAVSPNGSHVYVTAHSSKGIAIVNVENSSKPEIVGSVTADSRMYGAHGVAVSSDGKLLFVASFDASSLTINRKRQQSVKPFRCHQHIRQSHQWCVRLCGGLS